MSTISKSLLKKVVKNIIKTIDILIEEHGQDGMYELCEEIEKDGEYFKKLYLELSKLSNQPIHEAFFLKAIQEAIPDFNLNLVNEYTDIVYKRLNWQIEILNDQSLKYNHFLNLIDEELKRET